MFRSSDTAHAVSTPARSRSRGLPARCVAVLVLLLATWGLPAVQQAGPFAPAVAHADDGDNNGLGTASQVSGSGESGPDVPSPSPSSPSTDQPTAPTNQPAAGEPARHAAVEQHPVEQHPVGQAPTGQAHAGPAQAPVPQIVVGPRASTQAHPTEDAHQVEPAKREQPSAVTFRVEQRPEQGANLAAALVPDLPQETVGRVTLLLGAAALLALLSLYVAAYRKACGLRTN
mgnify:CR=1 FL=1|jgi:hypothetical protein